ncbi:MAG TPA: SDR family oxidoreductase, partial [Bacteroidetes bacterium]|nr:SDR family oxidoreductase [Bacteroidota bacterium]
MYYDGVKSVNRGKSIIFGSLNDKSISWKVAEWAYEEGAVFILSNAPTALRFRDTLKLAEKCGNTIVIPADVTRLEDIEEVFRQTLEYFGGKIDFILHSNGMSPNVRKKKPYSDLNYNYFHQTLDISILSFHRILQTAFIKKMSPLGNITSEECADYCVTLFSDITRKVTLQNLYHDGGFSSMGMSLRAMTQYDK